MIVEFHRGMQLDRLPTPLSFLPPAKTQSMETGSNSKTPTRVFPTPRQRFAPHASTLKTGNTLKLLRFSLVASSSAHNLHYVRACGRACAAALYSENPLTLSCEDDHTHGLFLWPCKLKTVVYCILSGYLWGDRQEELQCPH